MGKALDRLIELLDLEQIEVNIFRGQSPDENRQRVFGGQVAGQALVAAGRTVEELVRPGEPERNVHSIQHGKAIFTMSASFQVAEDGLDHGAPMPVDVPDPESLPDFKTRMA